MDKKQEDKKQGKKKKISSILRPLITILIVMSVASGIILGRSALLGFARNYKERFSKLAIRLKLDRLPLKIPFLRRFTNKKPRPFLPEEVPEEAILVKVYKIARRDFEDTMPSLGTVKGYREMDLKFEVNGIIDSINFREGEEVREGDIIASLDQYDSLLKLKYAKVELDRVKKLYEIGSVIKAALEKSELEYESAKSDLDKTYLYAPRDGILGTRDAEVGEFVTSNDKIVTLIDDSDVFVELGIIERDIGKIKIGQRGKVFVDAYPDIDFKGRVDNVSPVVEGRSRTQTVKIRVNNARRLLLPGMFARALTDIYAKKDAIVVPNTALNKSEEGYIVFVVHMAENEEAGVPEEESSEISIKEKAGDEGVVEARPVSFEYRSSDFSVIKEGLDEGELVVVETQERLREKMKVIVAEVQEQFL